MTAQPARVRDVDAPNRMHWMDQLRGVAILLVVLWHATNFRDDTPTVIQWVNDGLGPFRIPALLFASGVLLPRSLSKQTWNFIAGKLRGLAWPWLIWGVVMLRVVGISNIDSVGWWFFGGSHTWFLSALFLYYMVGLACRRVPTWAIAVGFAVAHWLMGFAPDSEAMYHVERLARFGVFFFAGAALSDRIEGVRFPRWVLPVTAAVGAGWAVRTVLAEVADRPPFITPVAITAGVLAICLATQYVPRITPVRALEWLGHNSIVIYVVHFPVLGLLSYVPLDLHGWIGCAVPFCVALAVSMLAVTVRPWTNWLYQFPQMRPPISRATE